LPTKSFALTLANTFFFIGEIKIYFCLIRPTDNRKQLAFACSLSHPKFFKTLILGSIYFKELSKLYFSERCISPQIYFTIQAQNNTFEIISEMER